MTMTAEVSEFVRRAAEMLQQVQAGNEVILTQESKPVARLVPALQRATPSGSAFTLHSLKGHRVLSQTISQADLAEEMFGSR